RSPPHRHLPPAPTRRSSDLRIDAHADNNEKCLKAQGHQGAQVVLAHAAPFPAHHGRHRDGSHRGHEIDFHHPAINDDEYADGERPHGNAHKQGLKPQAEQRPSSISIRRLSISVITELMSMLASEMITPDA